LRSLSSTMGMATRGCCFFPLRLLDGLDTPMFAVVSKHIIWRELFPRKLEIKNSLTLLPHVFQMSLPSLLSERQGSRDFPASWWKDIMRRGFLSAFNEFLGTLASQYPRVCWPWVLSPPLVCIMLLAGWFM
jgi:hypothetical protein